VDNRFRSRFRPVEFSLSLAPTRAIVLGSSIRLISAMLLEYLPIFRKERRILAEFLQFTF